jgi:serine/threonine protein kinase
MENKPLSVGTLLKNRYRINRLVAGGGMAWVYEAEESRPDGSRQIWAIKELRADADDSHTMEEGRALFEQEANILVRLNHPNLPRVVAFFEERQRSYLVMEFVHGESLEKRLERANAPLMESEVLFWALQICEVLAYLHARPQPVIFRDMKPSNVMVRPDGRIKLIDFGIARTYKRGKRKDTVTMGSENYAAPEQWGKTQTDPRADIYGLGATLYHLLTNVPPLPAFVPTPRLPIQQYNPAVSEATVAVVEKAMSEDRDDRYPTAEAMRDALLECLPRRERRRIEAQLRQHSSSPVPSTPAPVRPAPKDTPVRRTTVEPAQPTAPHAAPAAGPAVADVSKRCPRCSASNRPEARFCRRCGHTFIPPLPPVLALVRPAGAKWEFPLREGKAIIGRRGGQQPVDLDLDFYDPQGYISRNHAQVSVDRRRYYLTDLGSANGTHVNGQPLTPHQPRLLRHGDKIRMGRVVMHFRIR